MTTLITADTIDITDAPAIPGLVVRHFRGPADYPAMVACLNASEAAKGMERIVTVEEITHDYAHLQNCDLATDLVLAECNDQVVAYARCEWYKTDLHERIFVSVAFIRPEWLRRGLGSALLRWAEGRMREVAAARPHDGPDYVDGFALDSAPGHAALLVKHGYEPIRYGFQMVRPSLNHIPHFPLPAGLEVRPAAPEHYRLIWDADQEAFRDHWGVGPATEVDYERWLSDKKIFTPELWKIAWDVEKNEIAGQVRSFIDHEENREFQRKRGYTEFISTRRPYRRRGLARALIALSLHELKARGMTEAALGVDAQNPNGAVKVYEDCGFVVRKRGTRYRKTLKQIDA